MKAALYNPLVPGRRQFDLHKNIPSTFVRHQSEQPIGKRLDESKDRMAGVRTYYDGGDLDAIYDKNERPEYSRSNEAYGASMPDFFNYENTYSDVQRLRESLMVQSKLAHKGSESDLSVAEELFAAEVAVPNTNPHAAPKFNRYLRDQAAARRIENLKRLRADEFNSQMRQQQKQQEYKQYLDMQTKLKTSPSTSETAGPAYSNQPRYTRKSPKAISYDPLTGELKDYTTFFFREDFKPKFGSFSPEKVPGSYVPVPPTLLPSEMKDSVNAFYAAEESEERPKKKLAGYGQLVMNVPPPEFLYTRKSGLGYRPTNFLIR